MGFIHNHEWTVQSENIGERINRRTIFEFFKMGYAATLAAVLFLAIFLITIVQWRVAKSWVHGFTLE